MLPLPLSWRWRPRREEALVYASRLKASGLTWFHFADLPAGLGFDHFAKEHLFSLPKGYLLRGCLPATADFLAENGARRLPIGTEALLHTANDHFGRKSLRELTRRGGRHGATIEISTANVLPFENFWPHTAHGARPKLRRLFRIDARQCDRAFVFQQPDGLWLAALTLTRHSETGFHLETMMRRRNAPVGVMEALLSGVFFQLQTEGFHYLSLGEIPFHAPENFAGFKARSVYHIGRAIDFAYPARGLHQFKLKFNPQLRPLYLCASPRVSWRSLSDLFFAANCHRLVWRSAWKPLFK